MYISNATKTCLVFALYFFILKIALAGFFVIIGFPSAEVIQDEPKGIAYLLKIKKEAIEEDFDNASVISNEGKEELHEEQQEVRRYDVKVNKEKKKEDKVHLPPTMTPRKTPRRRRYAPGSSPLTPTSPVMVGEHDYGSVVTPLGRRSARVAKLSAKKL